MRAQCIVFSPTGGTRKIVEAFSSGLGMPIMKTIDLTLPKDREKWDGEVEGDLLVVGVPVNASSFPAVIYSSLKKLSGHSRNAVPIAVCGGIYVGDCLGEVSGLLRTHGFRIPAAGNFIAQHSFATDRIPLNKGRPNETDLNIAREFGVNVAKKVRQNGSDITTIGLGRLYLQCFSRGSLDAQGSYFPEKYHKDQYVTVDDKATRNCDKCGRCSEICPTGAIDSGTLKINDATCIRCFACVTKCEKNVLSQYLNYDSEFAALFMQATRQQVHPQTYL